MTAFTPDEQAVIDASEELHVGEADGWTRHLWNAFPAFKLKNYQLYFIGQLVSLVGTWLQIVAEGYLVYHITRSAYLVGVVTALGTLPILFFSLFGGVIVDKYKTKSLLLVTQTAAMLLAFLYGVLVITNHISVPVIGVLAFLLGTVSAIDLPARQSFIVEVVGREYLASAIAINSGMFNAARVIGPFLAGFLIAFIGVGGAFILNGVSYIASILSIYFLTITHAKTHTHPNPLKAIGDGLAYAFSHKTIRDLLIFAGGTAIFGWSYSTLIPVIANNDPKTLGILSAASGLGALTGAVIVSVYAKRVSPMKFILGGAGMLVISLLCFAFIHVFILQLVFLTVAGLGLLLQFSPMMTLMQFLVTDEFRGRAMSIFTLAFLGLSPFGSYLIGFLAEMFGTTGAILINVVFLSGFIFFIFTKRKYINKSYQENAHHPAQE